MFRARSPFSPTSALVLFISSPLSDLSLSVFLRKPLKDTQICRLSKSKNRSKNKAVAPQSKPASQPARLRVSHPQTQNIRVKRNPDRLQLTQTHTPTHTYIMERSLALCCGWKTALREPWVSELDKREYESQHIWLLQLYQIQSAGFSEAACVWQNWSEH